MLTHRDAVLFCVDKGGEFLYDFFEAMSAQISTENFTCACSAMHRAWERVSKFHIKDRIPSCITDEELLEWFFFCGSDPGQLIPDKNIRADYAILAKMLLQSRSDRSEHKDFFREMQRLSKRTVPDGFLIARLQRDESGLPFDICILSSGHRDKKDREPYILVEKRCFQKVSILSPPSDISPELSAWLLLHRDTLLSHWRDEITDRLALCMLGKY